jgi:hypothetical protein
MLSTTHATCHNATSFNLISRVFPFRETSRRPTLVDSSRHLKLLLQFLLGKKPMLSSEEIAQKYAQ